jgi:predicted alpha/beta superfamily hydrolase
MRFAAALLATIAIAVTAATAAAKPYTIPNTEIFSIHSKQTGADYQLFVSLPVDYKKTKITYPVVYMLDADYSFSLVRNVVTHFVEREDLPPMILVAIAYPGAATNRETYKMNRTRDYTPVYAPDGGYGAEYQKVSGGGPKFRGFLAREVIPFIERKFRTTPGDRTIIGHSYGGLFGTYVLLTEPALFKRYIIVSPSLWYSNRVAFSMEDTARETGLRPDARVFFSVGQLENSIMADDLTDMYKRLKARHLPNLQLAIQIFENERHNSVFPAAVTRGLVTVFDRPAPREEISPIPPQTGRGD